jgi:succinate dehydrogenase/fumarate reductase flavoprotein subunit
MNNMGHNSRFDPDAIAHELSKRGMEWADADAAYKALDDATKSVMANAMAGSPEKSNAASEADARRSDKFMKHLEALATARKTAARARVNFDVYKVWIELMRSQESSRRAEMTLR